MAPKLFTVKDLAAIFQKDDETIRRWIRDGDVFPNAFKVKDGYYVPVADVEKMMKRNADESDETESPKRRSQRALTGFVTGLK